MTNYLNKIIQGDCLEVMKGIPDKSVDMILCDLPYGTTACKWDTIIPFDKLWEQYKRVIRDDGAIVLFGNQPFTSLLISSNLEMFRYRWVWDKIIGANFQLAKLQPMNTAEDICVFSKAKTANGAKLNMRYYPIKTIRDKPIKTGGKTPSKLLHANNMKVIEKTYDDKCPISILTYSKENGKKRFHPTQKPVDLLEYLIRTYTLDGETVLDNCIGGGSTAIACINTNRFFIGIEQDEGYCAIANKRIAETREGLN